MLWTVKKALYRTQHRVMKTAAAVLPFPLPGLLTGPGSVEQLAENISLRGLERVLIVTDKILMGLDLPRGLLTALEARGVAYTIYDEVHSNPTIEQVEAGVKAYREGGCDSIVAFGGGSPIDAAKIIGARVANPYLSVRRMKGLLRVVMPIPPLFCVPTTAGTGSEATIVAVITDAATHEKFAINDLKLVPKIAVLDPELMVGMPPHITAATGMDALTHAVEAYIGLNGNEFTDANAKRATRLICSNLERAYKDGSDLDARYNMAVASYCAGLAFTRAYVGYVHAIAHNVGALYGVAHGLANAIIMPYVLEVSRREAEPKLAALARTAGITAAGDSDEALSHAFIERIVAMNERMNIPTFIAELKADDVPLIAERALAEAHPDYPVPKILTRPECEKLVASLMP